TGVMTLQVEKPTIPWTVFYVGAEGQEFGETCLAATTDATLLADVWSAFQTRQITTAPGASIGPTSFPLQYWGGWDASALTTRNLIRDGNGQCNSWVRLFIDTLPASGHAPL